eukprot:TRINITY_DN851_c0_g1_i1.p1 TRINITY_DN851_c0_g1~~TRINITY_DN851_c0_g1_i1.p1  ORF type:complete len:510 (+),score=149.64 TRINITY_DN851_c0_g1_i1:143-1672(+)
MALLRDRLKDLRTRARLPEDHVVHCHEETENLGLVIRKMGSFGKVYIGEHNVRVLVMKVLRDIDTVQEYAEQLRSVTTPDLRAKLQQQALLKECQCSKGVQSALTAINKYEHTRVDEGTMERLQHNFASRLREEVDLYMELFFSLRSKRIQDERTLSRRILGYAYPTASEDDYQRALNVPDLFASIMENRLKGGDKRSTKLCEVLNQIMESSQSLQRRLENDSLELQLLFFQFNMVTDKHDDRLAMLEEDLGKTLEETQAAIKNLSSATQLKRKNVRRRIYCYIFVFVVLFLIGGYIYSAYFGGKKVIKTPSKNDPNKAIKENVTQPAKKTKAQKSTKAKAPVEEYDDDEEEEEEEEAVETDEDDEEEEEEQEFDDDEEDEEETDTDDDDEEDEEETVVRRRPKGASLLQRAKLKKQRFWQEAHPAILQSRGRVPPSALLALQEKRVERIKRRSERQAYRRIKRRESASASAIAERRLSDQALRGHEFLRLSAKRTGTEAASQHVLSTC